MHVKERLQSGTALSRPGRQRRTRCVHVRARVDVFLAVVRQVVDEAAHRHVCDQRRGRHALVDDLRRNRLLHQCLAAVAGPLAADVVVYWGATLILTDGLRLALLVLAHALRVGIAQVAHHTRRGSNLSPDFGLVLTILGLGRECVVFIV